MREMLTELMLIPGLSGHEGRVARAIRMHLDRMALSHHTDRLGNLSVTIKGDRSAPSVMVFTHMDQLGFIIRKVEEDGLIRLERLGGVPERALAAQGVLICGGLGDVPGVIANKSHHATGPDEKYKVVPYADLYVDAGFASKAQAADAGVVTGTPVTYLPRVIDLAGGRIAGTSVDDRAGCAVLLALAERLSLRTHGPTVHLVWSVQEEFNLRGVLPAATRLAPDVALQIDLLLACDTPDMAARGDVALGGGPGISLYSFHGRGTLNGVIPHPALVRLMEETARAEGLRLQRSAHTGALTDLSYIQFMGPEGGLPRCRLPHALQPFRAGSG
jgi:putative aminopeptidase